MTYVMSDIHGYMQRFRSVMKQIKLQPEDMMRVYMVFGHIHENTNADYWPLIERSDRMLNAGVDINDFQPVTFRELVLNNQEYKRKSFEEH